MKMVQKTKPTKLGIQAASVKPSSSGQHLDGKSKTTDLKKKMKRSKSVKLSDTESCLRSSSYLTPLKKSLDLPGKPPPFTNPSTTTPIKKQYLIKTVDRSGSPNYMKSTSSSKARTESSQVSSHNLNRRSSTSPKSSGSGSRNRPTKAPARISSLKLVRTLTKAPSFKHKRSSGVALYADADAQRATCSSTMKDYEFPSYLELNQGGNESEGTSVLKVCPYNYCSLNGHHHSHLPPLKCFLSARRRAMKIRKGLKLEPLGPRKNKPSDNVTVEKDVEFGEANMSSLVKDGSLDFYIEIYGKSYGDDEGKQVSESLSDGSPCSEIELGDNIEQESVELLENDDLEEFMVPIYAPEVFSSPSSEAEDDICGALDMEWEEAQFSDSEAKNVTEVSPEAGEHSETNRSDLHLEHVVFSDEDDETEELIAVGSVLDFMEGGLYEEAGEDSKNGASENSSTIDVKEEASETSSTVLGQEGAWINEQNLVTDNLARDQVAPAEDDMSEVPSRTEKDEMESEHIEDSQNNCINGLKVEAMDPSNITCPPLFDDLTDGCNEVTATTCDSTSGMQILSDEAEHHNDDQEDKKQVPGIAQEQSQEVTNLSDCQYETVNDKGNQTDENESSLQKAPSTAKDKTMQEFLGQGSERWTSRRNRSDEDFEEDGEFNPRAPNFLPLVPEPDAEKVDLRHQMMDEKRNPEEWMLDYALRQTVTKLAPAKEKKVALLVEAFEKVMPVPKFESHLRHSSTPFCHGRPIQTCS